MELLRDRSGEFEAADVRLFGVSRDSPWTHIAWIQALELNFPLLSDWNGDAIRAFGIAREWRGYAEVAQRSAFMFERGGAVEQAWRFADNEVPDIDALLAAARSLRAS